MFLALECFLCNCELPFLQCAFCTSFTPLCTSLSPMCTAFSPLCSTFSPASLLYFLYSTHCALPFLHFVLPTTFSQPSAFPKHTTLLSKENFLFLSKIISSVVSKINIDCIYKENTLPVLQIKRWILRANV